jgi:YgiT-type zinc finger domain-containing protein
MADYAKPEYGRCPCTGYYQGRQVEVRLNVRGKAVVLTHVPQGACMSCGSRVYKAEIMERIESLLKHARIHRTI